MTRKYNREQTIDAIKGSGGVVSTIARRLKCDWHTAQKYVNKWVSTREAFQNEHEGILDLAESLLFRNVQLATKAQTDTGKPVDAGDAKWLLSRKGKKRGYAERREITGADEGPIQVQQLELTAEEEKEMMRAFYSQVLEEIKKGSAPGN